MSVAGITVLSSLPRSAVDAVATYQVDVEALARAARLDLAALARPDARVPEAAVQRFWTLALEATGDPCLGLVAAEHARVTNFHALGFAWLASVTLGDVLKRLLRYNRLLLSGTPWVFLEEEEDRVAVRLQPTPSEPGVAEARVDAAFAVLLRWCRGLTHRDFTPLQVDFRHDDHGQRARYEQALRAPLRFDASADRTWFSRESLDARLPGGHEVLAAEADQIAEAYLAGLDRDSFTGRVRPLLVDLLPQGEACVEAVAKRLGVSPRSLQRRLGAEGRSFRGLLEETRRTLAIEYVRDRSLALVEVAFRAGFADQSAFSKAFRRWTGVSPATFRARG